MICLGAQVRVIRKYHLNKSVIGIVTGILAGEVSIRTLDGYNGTYSLSSKIRLSKLETAKHDFFIELNLTEF